MTYRRDGTFSHSPVVTSRPRDQPFPYGSPLAHPLQFQEVLTQERQMRNMKTISKTGLKVNTTIKAGGITPQHNRRPGLKVNAGIKAGYNCVANHTRRHLAA